MGVQPAKPPQPLIWATSTGPAEVTPCHMDTVTWPVTWLAAWHENLVIWLAKLHFLTVLCGNVAKKGKSGLGAVFEHAVYASAPKGAEA